MFQRKYMVSIAKAVRNTKISINSKRLVATELAKAMEEHHYIFVRSNFYHMCGIDKENQDDL